MKLTKNFLKLSVRLNLSASVIIATIILMLSGNSIGYINSLAVFAAFSISGLVIICIELLFICGISVKNTYRSKATNIGRSPTNDVLDFDDSTVTQNEKLQEAFDILLLKNKLGNIYNSTAEKGARIRMKKTYIVDYAGLMTELIMFATYLTLLTLIVVISRDSFAYHSTRNSIRQVMTRHYFSNETREPIHIDLFLEYLQNDFLPTIHTDSDNQSSHGWLKDGRMKILGTARLRQQRVKKDPCTSTGLFNTPKCVPTLGKNNEDKANYDPSWRSQSKIHSKEKYWRILQPWIYQNSFESQTIPQFGKSMLYSGGGYTCNLGRTLNNSLLIVEFIKKHNWIDRRTSVVFIEFTSYGVDSNIFTCFTLIAERTAIGYFEFSYNIQSVQLLTIIENLSGTTIFIFMSYVVIISLFIWRIVLTLLQTNLRQYFSKIWNIVDLIIVAQSLGIVAIFFIRNQYVRSLLSRLEETRNNEFVSFLYAGFLDQFMLWWAGILVCISTIRIWKILNFIFIFRVFSTTLVNSAKDLIASTALTMVFFICFGMLFYQLNSYKSASFSSLSKSFSSLVAILFGFITDRLSSTEIFSGSNWIELLLFVVSLGVVAIYLMNMIITVSCIYFSLVRKEAKSIKNQKFSFCDFIREEYSGMFAAKRVPKTSRNLNSAYVRSNDRLVKIEKKLNRTIKSMEDFF